MANKKPYFLTIVCMAIWWSAAFLQVSQAQNHPEYTEDQLIAFYTLYSYELSNPFEPLMYMDSLLRRGTHSISYDRMTEIMQAYFYGQEPALSHTEKKALNHITRELAELQKIHEKRWRERLLAAGLSMKLYEEMKRLYHEDAAFRQQVHRVAAEPK